MLRLSQRLEVYVFPEGTDRADDIILDRLGNTYPVSDKYGDIVTREVPPRPGLRLYYQANELIWLQREDVPAIDSSLAVFGEGSLKLLDVQLPVAGSEGFFDQLVDGTIDLQPGNYVQVSLLWEGFKDSESDYPAFVQLLEIGSGAVIGQHDGPPAGGAVPAYNWRPVDCCGMCTISSWKKENGSGPTG